MAKYFIDTEFIEGFWDAVFWRKRHFIDLISIGIVAEDGRTYSAISNEYNYADADKWVQDNVIIPLYIDTVHGDSRNRYNTKTFHKTFGRSNKTIATEIYRFLMADANPEFYAYYADYDWVLFCSLYGRMIDLPETYPMYCKDLKQMLDDKAEKMSGALMGLNNNDFKEKINKIKEFDNYPKQTSEHNALADAKWNYELYKFLNTI